MIGSIVSLSVLTTLAWYGGLPDIIQKMFLQILVPLSIGALGLIMILAKEAELSVLIFVGSGFLYFIVWAIRKAMNDLRRIYLRNHVLDNEVIISKHDIKNNSNHNNDKHDETEVSVTNNTNTNNYDNIATTTITTTTTTNTMLPN